ncbi:MAG: branched-chain amino acid ABC transporter permease [Clostridiales Family XIII bacterium]|jgi:branched-chain amino acid transport system permease protein|nr:branched-chain amino acid ABC transporter permease [Clostridiales Family XIII bacterium]
MEMSKSSKIRVAVIIIVILCLYLVPGSPLATDNMMRIGLLIALYCTLGLMWNLMAGYTGMVSLGQQIFIGIAGYNVAVFATTFGLPFWAGMFCGAGISVLLSVALSFLLFRMKGMYFAIATWITSEALKIIFTSWEFVNMGGGMTIKLRPYPGVFELYYIALTLAIGAFIVVFFVLNSRIGLGLKAMRDDDDAAAASGVNIFRAKLLCFMISGFVTGLCGALFYINQGSIFPGPGFGISWTVAAVFIVIIGGIGTITGPIVGAVIYVFLSEFLSRYQGYSMIILGVIAIAVILGLPYGIVGTIERKFGFEVLSTRRIMKNLLSGKQINTDYSRGRDLRVSK